MMKYLCNKVGDPKHLLYQKAHAFSCEFCEIFKNTHFDRTPKVAARETGFAYTHRITS